MIERACLHCGKPFQVPYPSSKRVNCSEPCRIARLRQPGRKRRADSGTRKAEWVAVACGGCGKDFELPPWRFKRGTAVYCSRKCRDRAPANRYATGPRGDLIPKARRLRGDGRFVANTGYVMVYVPPVDRPLGKERVTYWPEHRVVMRDVLGRWPDPKDTVHHVNGDKTDNRPENLQLRNGNHGRGALLRCRCCGSSDIECIELPDQQGATP